jgi:dihydrofolate synthase/folylpolyglutamate synthase
MCLREPRIGQIQILRAEGIPSPVVHVAGTSGKGSTCANIAAILTAAGYRVGLHTSPYLQVATEKLQLGGRLIAADAFADLVADVLAAAGHWSARAGQPLTYGEIWMALVARWFAAEQLDAAVIEVGAGGRFDPTNVVRPVLSVITSVGLDHTATLGGSIAEIAWHKAGIVKPGARVISAVADPEARAAIDAEAAAVGAPMLTITPEPTAIGTGAAPSAAPADLPDFRRANAALASAAVAALAEAGFTVSPAAIAQGLATSRLPGRLEPMPTAAGPPVVLDGAHNPDKVAALVAALPMLGPAFGRGRPVFVVGAIRGKDATTMLRRLLPHAAAVVASTPHVVGKEGVPAAALAAAARSLRFAGEIVSETDPAAAVARARDLAAGVGGGVLVTGSLYLVGAARARWYPDAAVVAQRTPWPAVSISPSD